MSIIKLCMIFSETALFYISWNNGQSRLCDLIWTGCSGWSSDLVGGPSSVNATKNKKHSSDGYYQLIYNIFRKNPL